MAEREAFQEAALTQGQFEAQFAADPNVLGIGLGLNAAGDGPALVIQVANASTAQHLPDHFGGLEVVVIVVGEIRPQ